MRLAVARRLAWTLLIASSPVLLVVSCGIFAYMGCAHPSDRTMEQRFFEHRRDFEQLVQLFQQDSTMIEGPYLDQWSPSGLSKMRRQRYEELYRRLKVLKIERDGGVILIRASTTHIFDRKGYAWCDQAVASINCGPFSPPRRVLASAGVVVDGETTREAKYQFRVFRRIATGWYLYFQPSS